MVITSAVRWANELLHKLCRTCGVDFVSYSPISHPLARRRRLLETYNINVVLDVGANTGGYGTQLRSLGYRRKIISFEPIKVAFRHLQAAAASDGLWQVHNFALGDRDESTSINVARNIDSSSLLEMLPAHVQAAPQSEYVRRETIQLRTLDRLFHSLCAATDSIYLKIDTQGFEEPVLRGAAKSLQFIDTIQLEMSLVPLYQDQRLFHDMHKLLGSLGYVLVSIEPGFIDEQSAQVLQIDGVYHRNNDTKNGSPRAPLPQPRSKWQGR